MSLYNPHSKTIVTEIKSFLVDAVRKVSTVQNTVSAKLDDDQALTQRDINVGSTFVDLGLVSKHIVISGVKPIELEITQTTEILTYPVITHTATITVATSIYEDQPLLIVVTDPDSILLSTVQVLVSNEDTGEQETVVLTREPNTDRFVGTLATSVTGGSIPEDGTLTIFQGQFLNVAYTDQENSTGVTQIIERQVAVLPNPTYTATLRLEQFTPGSDLTCTIFDKNSSVSIVASVYNERTFEQEQLILAETIAGSGIFVGVLATSDDVSTGVDNDQVLFCQTTDVISLNYEDTSDSSGQSQTLQTTMQIGTQTFTTGSISVLPLRPGEPLVVTVTDSDKSGSILISVTNQTTNEIENMVLNEVTPLSGVFRGMLNTELGTTVWYKGPDDDDVMVVKAGDLLILRYNDAYDISGQPLLVQSTINVSPGLPPPVQPDPVISYDDQTVLFTAKLFVVDGSVGTTRIRLRKPDINTDQYVRVQVLLT
jgi:hypothetical protein